MDAEDTKDPNDAKTTDEEMKSEDRPIPPRDIQGSAFDEEFQI